MTETLTQTQFTFPGQLSVYHGKVRDVYRLQADQLVMIPSDRISAFDVILPAGIPYKGQVLNQLAARFLDQTGDIVPNWKRATPHPYVTVGVACEPIKIEMVIRGYLAGHAWRTYASGERTLCGVTLPEGLRENDPFPNPIITPATKADEGHDEDISADEILRRGMVTPEVWEQLVQFTRQLFQRGTEHAAQQGLILVDTKYEFGIDPNGVVTLIDEIHTPDSSRYFYAEGYEERQASGERQKQLSKEFVREWLMENGFQGRAGDVMPTMTPEFVQHVSGRYIELFEKITGSPFEPFEAPHLHQSIEEAVLNYLASLR